MIEKLRHIDDETVSAVGPKFDLEKVLEAGHGLILLLAGRSAMRFPEAPPSVLETPEGPKPLDAGVLGELAKMYRQLKAEAFDVCDLCVYFTLGPYMVSWSPLGVNALCGPVGNCITIFEEDWSMLDPTPMLLVHAKDKPFQPMGRERTRFALETLKPRPHGAEVVSLPHDHDADTIVIRFPHDAFGDGRGPLRIFRYFDPDLEIEFDSWGAR